MTIRQVGGDNKVHLIEQTEPMYTVRSREIIPQEDGTELRGQRSRIRLLSAGQSSASVNGFSDRALSKLIQDRLSPGFQDFLLVRQSFSYRERHQIKQPIGDSEVVNFFGRAPMIMDMEGLIVDDVDNQWFPQFAAAYEQFMRGSALARNRSQLQIDMPSMSITGPVLDLSLSRDSSRKVDVYFQMRVLVRDIQYSEVGIDSYLQSESDIQSSRGFLSGILNTKRGGLSERIGSTISAARGAATTATGFATSTFGRVRDFAGGLFGKANEYISKVRGFSDNVTGGANRIIGGIVNPINDINSGARSVSREITGLAGRIREGYRSGANTIAGGIGTFRNLSSILQDTAGYLSFLPEDFTQTLSGLIGTGRLSGASIGGSGLGSGGSGALLGTTNGASSNIGALIGTTNRGNIDEARLRNSVSSYDPSQGARL